MFKSRLILEWCLIAVAVLGTVIFAVTVSFGHRIDNLIYDQVSAATAPPASPDIILVEIDDRSLAQLGAWPWSRTVHARLIDRLTEAKPKAIAYDILFTEPNDPAGDQALAESIARSGKIILPLYVRSPGSNGRDSDIVLPIPAIAKAAAAMGHVNLMFEGDGMVRRVQQRLTSEGESADHFMFATAGVAYGQRPRLLAGDSAPVLIPYQPVGAYQHISFGSVLNGEVPADFFRGKIVLVGATALGMRDSYPVPGPAGDIMSGVELQANMLNGLMSGGFVSTVSKPVKMALSVIPALLLLMSFWFFRPTSNFIMAVGVFTVTFLSPILFLAFGALWFPPAAALLGIAMAYPLWSWRRLATLSAFVETETRGMRARSGAAEQPVKGALGLDSTAQSALQMKSVIGQIEGMKDFMAGVIAAVPDALCVLDRTGTVILANDAAQTLFPVEAVGRKDRDILASLLPTTPNMDGEIELSDGRVLMVDRVGLNRGAPSEAGAIWRLADVTRLREAAQEREEMLEFLSHDMRSPQASIITLINQAKTGGAPSDMLSKISAHAQLTLKLADDFVQLARLSIVEPQPEECDLTALMNEAIDGGYARAHEKNITLVRPDDREIVVIADPWPVMRALSNLIDNAVKYSPAFTSVTCSVGWDEAAFCIVSDNGPGIPEDRKGNIFERFGSASTGVSLSSGLGLAFVQKTMDRHGGQAIYTDLKPGSRFTLRFKS